MKKTRNLLSCCVSTMEKSLFLACQVIGYDNQVPNEYREWEVPRQPGSFDGVPLSSRLTTAATGQGVVFDAAEKKAYTVPEWEALIRHCRNKLVMGLRAVEMKVISHEVENEIMSVEQYIDVQSTYSQEVQGFSSLGNLKNITFLGYLTNIKKQENEMNTTEPGEESIRLCSTNLPEDSKTRLKLYLRPDMSGVPVVEVALFMN